MRTFVISLVVLLCATSAGAHQDLKITVVDSTHHPIPFCNVIINKKVQILADSTGVIYIPKRHIHLQDTIAVSFIGYQTKHLIVDRPLMEATQQQVMLQEQVYNLDEVKVKSKYSALKFFKKKKKRFICVHSKKREVPMEVAYKDYTQTPHVDVRDQFTYDFQHSFNDKELHNSQITDTLIRRRINRAYMMANYSTNMFCYPSQRKRFDTKYIGRKDDQYVFEFTLRKKYYNRDGFKLSPGDQVSMQVTLNLEGYITHMKQHVIIQNDPKACYELDVDYKTYDEQFFYPTDIHVRLYYSNTSLSIKTQEKLRK